MCNSISSLNWQQMHTITIRIGAPFGTPRPVKTMPTGMDRTPGARDNRAMNPAPPALRPQPHSLTDLFVSFTWLALQGFGGVLAVVQRELVDRKGWLTQDEFIEDWAVAQIMPGPNGKSVV